MFWVLHVICMIFFIPGLVVTIPLHLIYNLLSFTKE